MANINTELEQIRKAVYGREVRGSIANAIELINKEQVNTSTAQTNLDSKFNQLVINAGNSNAEVVAARVKADGTQFDTLGKRLDKSDEVHDTLNNEVVSARTDSKKTHKNLKARLDNFDSKLDTIETKSASFYACNFISKLERGEEATVVFLGDSTTADNDYSNKNHVTLFREYLTQRYGNLVKTINAGVNGDTSVKIWNRLFSSALIHNPDLIILNCGINDYGGSAKITLDKFKQTYENILKEITTTSNANIILRTSNVTKLDDFNTNLPVWNKIVLGLALKYNCGYYDLFTEEKEDINNNSLNLDNIMHDTIHPNDSGHEYIFNKMKFIFNATEHKEYNNILYKCIDANSLLLPRAKTTISTIKNSAYFNNYVLKLGQNGDYCCAEFNSDEFTIIYTSAPGQGVFEVYVDGKKIDTVTAADATTNFRTSKTYSVSNKTHFVKILNISASNIQFEGIIYKKMSGVSDESKFNSYNLSKIKIENDVTLKKSTMTMLPLSILAVSDGDCLEIQNNKIKIKKHGIYNFISTLALNTTANSLNVISFRINGSQEAARTVILPTDSNSYNTQINSSVLCYPGDEIEIGVTTNSNNASVLSSNTSVVVTKVN